MRSTLPLLMELGFPPIHRIRPDTLQVNLGYRCNQSCAHCHVAAGPTRGEQMSKGTVDDVLEFVARQRLATLDLTGGAPELNPHFRYLVQSARSLGVKVIDRCNLTILEEPGQNDLAEFLALNEVAIVASLPCYREENVDKQRGKGVFAASLRALKRLNALGFAAEGLPLTLDLVFNPLGATLPPSQEELEADYKRELMDRFGILFNRLLTLTNMPIQRFGSQLVSSGQFDSYLRLLRSAHREGNLDKVMCRNLLSVDWQGCVYDCDFNQMLGIPMTFDERQPWLVSELLDADLSGAPIRVAGHCFACTAGQGSGCQGSLTRVPIAGSVED